MAKWRGYGTARYCHEAGRSYSADQVQELLRRERKRCKQAIRDYAVTDEIFVINACDAISALPDTDLKGE